MELSARFVGERQPRSQGPLPHVPWSERERPWKRLVTCLPESGRQVTSVFQGLSLQGTGTLGERTYAILLTHYLSFLYIQSIGSLVLPFFVVTPNSVPYQELNLAVNRTRTNKVKLFQ